MYLSVARRDFSTGVKERIISGVIIGKFVPLIFIKLPRQKIKHVIIEKSRILLTFLENKI